MAGGTGADVEEELAAAAAIDESPQPPAVPVNTAAEVETRVTVATDAAESPLPTDGGVVEDGPAPVDGGTLEDPGSQDDRVSPASTASRPTPEPVAIAAEVRDDEQLPDAPSAPQVSISHPVS